MGLRAWDVGRTLEKVVKHSPSDRDLQAFLLYLPTSRVGYRVGKPIKSGVYCLNMPYNRPFPSSKKSHFQSEAKCEAIDMKMIFNYDAKKLIFTTKVSHLASFWKWDFLELGNGLFDFLNYWALFLR